ncbi:DNA-binding response regulator [Amycolatopsis sp. NBRC 101858]|uniref:response regulator n=1 Tax=Amycolatopsis sp. NBRC 101858 TaxID=3032200 RepID=UPI0024A1807C|nr:response regulator transcription factor [Amycolatopsis sp. NBRC 101858]GLY35500.1 DNA-binding response regulator [Amycolatopsis sp. NBRC 101858]
MTEPVRVLVVDDEPMVGEFLRSLLDGAGRLTVVAVGHDGAEGVELVVRHEPHVVLMDLRMPGVDGVRATREIRALPDPPAVIAMTTVDTDEHVLGALDAGASGFILKTTPPAQLVPLVLAAAAGTAVLSPETLDRLRRGSPPPPDPPDPRLARLGGRERDVLGLLGEGRTNAEIASRLYLSEGTVKGVVSRLMTHLDCTNRTQLALLAARGIG